MPSLEKMTCIEDLRVVAQSRVPRMFYDYADTTMPIPARGPKAPTAPTKAIFRASSSASVWR